MKLLAPKKYLEAPPAFIDEITGGCGPGGFGDWVIPDRMWGLSIKPACMIHDWEYHFGTTSTDKSIADDNFLDNMIRIIIDADGYYTLRWLRRQRAAKYHFFVVHFGGPSFWSGKDTEYVEVV